MREIGQRNARKQVVELSLSTAFVTHWFVPRMREFHAAFPEVDLRFQLTSGALRGPLGNVDLAMRRCGTGEADDCCWPFAPEIVLPVCSPAYLARHGPSTTARPRARHVLLQLPDTEIDWLRLLGKRADAPSAPAPDRVLGLCGRDADGHERPGYRARLGQRRLAHAARRALVPAPRCRLETGQTFCLVSPRGRPVRASCCASAIG